MPEPRQVVAPRLQADRRPGVDLARGAAIVAMVIAHVKAFAPDPPEPLHSVLTQVNNLASPLFALVMGVSLGIVLARARTSEQDRRALVVHNLVRGLLLVVIGLLLEEPPHFVAVVLQSLGVTLAVGTPIALLAPRLVALVAGVLFVVGPAINAAARATLDPARVATLGPLDPLLEWVVLSPYYRLVNLLPLFLAGVVVARLGLTRRVLLTMLAVGLVAYVVAGAARLAADGPPVSGDLVDNVSDLGLSFPVFALVVLAGDRLGALGRRLLQPVSAMGTLSLSVYVLHVLLISLVLQAWPSGAYSRWPLSVAIVVIVTVAAAWAWWRYVGKGPIEVLLGLVSGRYALR